MGTWAQSGRGGLASRSLQMPCAGDGGVVVLLGLLGLLVVLVVLVSQALPIVPIVPVLDAYHHAARCPPRLLPSVCP